DARPNRWESLAGIETEIGGVLFLLNVAAQLDLPRCFDEQCGLSDHLSAWGIAELFGRAFLKAGGGTANADEFWALLARLDGRNPGAPIAPGFIDSPDYYIPVEWLSRYCDEPHEWTAARARGRLLIRDRLAGYPVIDVQLKGRRARALSASAIE